MSIIDRRSQSFEETGNLMRRNQSILTVEDPQIICKRGSLQVFHYNIGMTIDGVEIKNLNDIGVAQGGDDFRFSVKSFEQCGLFFDMAVEQFDGDRALEIE